MDVVIGIGNSARCDDGVGRRLVESVAPRADLTLLSVHQLTPELALELRDADRVLFVDADIAAARPRIDPVEAAASAGVGHAVDPRQLLEWTRMAFERVPSAWVLRIPGAEFGFGETLSPRTEDRLPEARAAVEAWLAEARPSPPEGGEEEA